MKRVSAVAFEWSLVAAASAICAGLVLLVSAIEIPALDADGLHSYLLVRDLIDRQGDVIWQCTTNFYFFPALIFVALGEALFDDLGLVHLASFAAQALALAGAGVVYARIAAPLAPPRRWILAALSLLCLYLVALIAWPFFGHTAFRPTSHGMHYPVAVLVIGAFLATITRSSRTSTASFVGLGSLLLLSDVIFLNWLFAPLAIASFAAFGVLERDLRKLRRATLLIGAPFFLSIAGKLAVEWTGRFNRRTLLGAHRRSEVFGAFQQLVHDLPSVEGALALAALAGLALLAAGALLLAARRPRVREGLDLGLGRLGASRLLWMSGILAAGMITTLLVPLATGAWNGPGSTRYFTNLAFLPVLWLSHVALAAAAAGRAAVLGGFALVSLVLGIASAVFERDAFDPRRLLAPYPARIAALDALAQSHGLRFGLAHFDLANPVRSLSRQGLVVVAVKPSLRPYLWSTSADVYFQTTGYDFVIPQGLDREAVLRRIGPPRRIESAGSLEVWIYDREADAARFASFREAAAAEVARRGLMLREEWTQEPPDAPLR